jgi:hypothetical protein
MLRYRNAQSIRVVSPYLSEVGAAIISKSGKHSVTRCTCALAGNAHHHCPGRNVHVANVRGSVSENESYGKIQNFANASDTGASFGAGVGGYCHGRRWIRQYGAN